MIRPGLFSTITVSTLLTTTILISVSTQPNHNRNQSRCGNSTSEFYQIAVLLPDLRILRQNQTVSYSFSIPFVRPAIELGLERVRDAGLLDRPVRVHYADSQCDIADAIDHAINFCMERQVDVFFGPVCDYSAAPVAREVVYWNVPMLTPGTMSQHFQLAKKSRFSLLTRIGPTFESMSLFVANILEKFDYHKIMLLFNSDGQKSVVDSCCQMVMTSLSDVLSDLQDDPNRYNITHEHKIFNKTRRESYITPTSLLKGYVGTANSVIALCANPDTVREIMITAFELGFANGEYVFLNIDLFSSDDMLKQPWKRDNDSDEVNRKARLGYRALKTITLPKPDSPEYRNFSAEVKRRSPVGLYDNGTQEVNWFVAGFHDAAIAWAIAVNKTIADGMNPTNGAEVTRRMWNRSFQGITGNFTIDDNGDRINNYLLLDMNPSTDTFEVIANYYGTSAQYSPVPNLGREIQWPPSDIPKCGYDGSKCEPFPLYGTAIIVLCLALVAVSLISLLIYKRLKFRIDVGKETWKIRWDNVQEVTAEREMSEIIEPEDIRSSLIGRMVSQVTLFGFGNCPVIKQRFTSICGYDGEYVAYKKIQKKFNINYKLKVELKKMTDLQNEHIARFIGVCTEPTHAAIFTEYCLKGSLQDVLANEQVDLDTTFKFSIIQDIIRGMNYLHNSEIRSHGNLKSTNCVVDNRFVVKITDFGIHALRGRGRKSGHEEQNPTYADYYGKLWTAPELLRMDNNPPEGTQKGDVYSFAIICQEVVKRASPHWPAPEEIKSEKVFDPFWRDSKQHGPQDIVELVKKGEEPYTRPALCGACGDELDTLITKCWSERPTERPNFHAIKTQIRSCNKTQESGTSLVENLLQRMECFANNLESLVEARTNDYLLQKKRAENLLYRMMPEPIAKEYMTHPHNEVQPKLFKSVTIYFSDIVKFTDLARTSTPIQIVDLLNKLYTAFDLILDPLDVYKVETIGDAYMVVSGLPTTNKNQHVCHISRMALKLLRFVKQFEIPHRPRRNLLLRIGIHSGEVCACVVGKKMPRYCLVGDTVNTASRMESNGFEWRIHISSDTKRILEQFGTFVFEKRDPIIFIKGKGFMETWWLLGERTDEHLELNTEQYSEWQAKHQADVEELTRQEEEEFAKEELEKQLKQNGEPISNSVDETSPISHEFQIGLGLTMSYL